MADPHDDQALPVATDATSQQQGTSWDDGSAGATDGANPPTGSGTYVGDPTPASDPKYKIPHVEPREENEIFYRLASVHPFAELHEATFIDLLEHSLSLPTDEKKAVVDAIPRLSQYQVDELVKVFVDEREEFKKIFSEDKDLILRRIEDIRKEWAQLKDIYLTEEMERNKKGADQSEVERLKAMLGNDGTH